MAYVVPTGRGSFEVRESRSTAHGPRSRTLATFRELDEATIRKALERASGHLDRGSLQEAALRAGASVAPRPADRAAGELVRRLARGERINPALRRLLLDRLGERGSGVGKADRPGEVSDAAREASAWIGVPAEERGAALRDLLELADALPVQVRSSEIDFPRLESGEGR